LPYDTRIGAVPPGNLANRDVEQKYRCLENGQPNQLFHHIVLGYDDEQSAHHQQDYNKIIPACGHRGD
jgi:hypothetical protein